MTPRSGVKTTPGTKRAFRGSRTQAGAPNFFDPRTLTHHAALSINLSGYRDVRLAENVRHLRFLQARSIVFKG